MKLTNNIKAGRRLRRFIYSRVSKYSISNLQTVKLLRLTKENPFHGWCKKIARRDNPEDASFHIKCSVHFDIKYPMDFGIRLSRQKGVQGKWAYTYHDEVLQDEEELVAFLFGHELYHFLCWTGQLKSKNTEIKADHFGLATLQEFRVYL